MCMFCRLLCVLLFLFFWPLCCLSFFDLPLWYLQALLGYICLVNMGRSSEWMISVYGEIYWMNKQCTWGSLLVVPVRFAWRKPEYPLEIPDLPQVTVKLYHMMCLFFFHMMCLFFFLVMGLKQSKLEKFFKHDDKNMNLQGLSVTAWIGNNRVWICRDTACLYRSIFSRTNGMDRRQPNL